MYQIVMFVDDFHWLVALWQACYEEMDKVKHELVIQQYVSKYRRQQSMQWNYRKTIGRKKLLQQQFFPWYMVAVASTSICLWMSLLLKTTIILSQHPLLLFWQNVLDQCISILLLLLFRYFILFLYTLFSCVTVKGTWKVRHNRETSLEYHLPFVSFKGAVNNNNLFAFPYKLMVLH